jgi:hypothetical protein
MPKTPEEKAQEAQAALNKMFVKLARGLKKEPVVIITLQPGAPFGMDARVSFSSELAPEQFPKIPLPRQFMLPNALAQVLHEQGVMFTLPPDAGRNTFDCRLENLHGAVIGDGFVLKRVLQERYNALTGGLDRS